MTVSQTQSVANLPYPKTLSKKLSKVVEAAQSSLTFGMFAAASAPSHVVKFVRTGSTSATLTGVAVGDVCVHWIASSGLVNIAAAVATNTLPNGAPASGDFVIVLRVAA